MARFSPAEWATLSRLLDEALELAPEQRAAWIAKQHIEHPSLVVELEALLARESQIDEDGFMSASQAPELPPRSTLVGQILGAYTLERPLGEGGMGSVWLARRNDGRFEGVAAIKLLSLAVSGPAGEARFRREGSALARLTQPNIARLLDAGLSPSGLPYLVLEYIDGQPIDAWCDARRVSVEGRLRLFEQVLAAVAHAHANFIVHRDLKPANILVTSDGVVKLLDFGIAKLLEEGGATSPSLTAAHETMFTYRYAAPEQIKGEVTTTATDVYALGVVLYELLAGRHPTSDAAHSPAEHVVAILESDSGHLSRALTPSSTLTAEHAQELAAARDASPERLRRTLEGDLDNIVAKALKKSPAERYATVSELAADVRHYLNHEPVTARADSFGYRAGKFVRRHRVPVALAALAVMGLVGAAVRERELRGRAELEAKKAVAVEDYLVSIFGAVDPYAQTAAKPEELTARALLDRGAQRIDTALSSQPDVRAELRGALGRVYANLAVYDKATIQLRNSLAERRRIYGADNAAVAEAMDQLGEVLMKEDSLDEADTLLRGGLAIRRKLFGNRSDVTAESAEHLAELLSNKDAFPSADTLYREALEIRREIHGDSDLTVANTRAKLGQMLNDEGKYPDAVAQFQQVLAIRERRLGAGHPSTAETLHDLANSEQRLGEYAEAETHYRAALAGERKALGNEHRSVSVTLNDFGQMLFKVGRLDEADSMLREALAINRKLFGENHDAVSANLGNLAIVVRERGDFDEAQRLLEQGLAIDRKLYGVNHIDVGFDLNEIAVVMRLKGRADSAVTILRPVLAVNRQLVGGNNLGTITISVNFARALDEAGRDREAEPLLRDALARLDTMNVDQQLVVIPARIGLGRVLVNTHRAKEAVPLLESVVAMSRVRQGPQHWRTGESEVVLAQCWMELGRADSADAPLRDARVVLDKARRAHPLLAKEADAAGGRFAEMRKTK